MAEATLFEDDPSAGQPTYTVAALTAELGQALRRHFTTDIWVEGEIRNITRSKAGHVYFDLVEPAPAGEQPLASVSVVLFSKTRELVNRMLRATGGVRMNDGIQIRIRGTLDFYPPQGRLQVRMTGIDPSFTLGQLAADRERLLAALRDDQLLDRNRSLPFPALPLRISLVTSSGSAAYEDFMAELRRSALSWQVRVLDTRVQGLAAVESICRALLRAPRHGDVAVVVRGGGARTDLVAFDSEAVARAVAACPIPVITGIGHEIDRSVVDEVAAHAHKTPTAAAAWLIEVVTAVAARLDTNRVRLEQAAESVIASNRRDLGVEAERAQRSVAAAVRLAAARVDVVAERLTRAADRRSQRSRAELEACRVRVGPLVAAGVTARRATIVVAVEKIGVAAERSIDRSRAALRPAAGTVALRARRTIARASQRIDGIDSTVRALDPARLLARGWSITRTDAGHVVRATTDVAGGDRLTIELADGHVRTTVDGLDQGSTGPGDRP